MEAKKYDQFADTLPDDVVDSYDKNKKQKKILVYFQLQE